MKTTTDLFIAFFRGDPKQKGSELSALGAKGYRRIRIDEVDITFKNEKIYLSNVNVLESSVAYEQWPVITHYAVMDALASNEPLFTGRAAKPVRVGVGDHVRFHPGAFRIG